MKKNLLYYNNLGQCTVNIRVMFKWLFEDGLQVNAIDRESGKIVS